MLEYNIDVVMSTIILPSVNKNLDNGKTISFHPKHAWEEISNW